VNSLYYFAIKRYIVTLMAHELHITNDKADWDWPPGALDDYLGGNYQKLAREDQVVAAVGISAVDLYARQNDLYGELPSATQICSGAVPRGAALFAPLVRPVERGGYIDISDLKPSNVEATRRTMSQLALGNLGLWTPHQRDYAAVNPRWANAFQEAGILAEGHVHAEDMRDLEPESQHAIGVEHGPESATTEEDEYQEFIRIICRALLPGGILYMAYMRGSLGYKIGGITKPAFPVDIDYVTETLHANNMRVLVNAGTDASHSIRTDGDDHSYSGIGMVVAIRK
jgi:hypothetical protein